jgi:hypothetical protein
VRTVNISGTDIAGGKTNVQARAAGGPAPSGYFTVGEQGWELAKNAGGKVQIFSHAQSMAMTGLPVSSPAWVCGRRRRQHQPAVQWRRQWRRFRCAGSGSSRAAVSRGSATVKIDYQVDGKHYASLHAAENAALSAYRANVHLAATIEGKGFSDWRKALAGSVADARAAFSKIRADAKKLGVSDAFVAGLTRIEQKTQKFVQDRNKVQAALGTPASTATTAYDRLASAVQKFRDERSSVADAVKGSFDVTSAGANPVTGAITGQGIAAQSKQNLNSVKKFVHDATALRGKINNTYWAELVGKGPEAEPQIAALLSLPKGLRCRRSTVSRRRRRSSPANSVRQPPTSCTAGRSPQRRSTCRT